MHGPLAWKNKLTKQFALKKKRMNKFAWEKKLHKPSIGYKIHPSTVAVA